MTKAYPAPRQERVGMVADAMRNDISYEMELLQRDEGPV